MGCGILSRLASLVRNLASSRVGAIDDELRTSVEMLAAKTCAPTGSDAARRGPRRVRGSVKKTGRAVRSGRSGLRSQDIRYAVRMLRDIRSSRGPLRCRAVGIGASTACSRWLTVLVSLAASPIRTGLDIDAARRSPRIQSGIDPNRQAPVAHDDPRYVYARCSNRPEPSGSAAPRGWSPSGPRLLRDLAGQAAAGVCSTDESDRPARANMCAQSSYWLSRFNANPDRGSVVRVNRKPVTVVGFAGEGFRDDDCRPDLGTVEHVRGTEALDAREQMAREWARLSRDTMPQPQRNGRQRSCMRKNPVPETPHRLVCCRRPNGGTRRDGGRAVAAHGVCVDGTGDACANLAGLL